MDSRIGLNQTAQTPDGPTRVGGDGNSGRAATQAAPCGNAGLDAVGLDAAGLDTVEYEAGRVPKIMRCRSPALVSETSDSSFHFLTALRTFIS